MKRIYCFLIVLLSILFVENSYSQPYPVLGSGGSQVTPGGVWSKNMELICPLSLPWNSHEMFQFQKIKYGSSLGSTGHYIITTERKPTEDPSESSYIRVVDVTNPRSINADAVKIRVQTATDVYTDLHDIEAWTDNSTGNTFSGHTFAVVFCNDVTVATSPSVIKAAYLIFDLTEALTCGATTITVADPTQRVVSGTGLNSTYEKSVYLGYLRRDNKYMRKPGDGTVYGPHTTFVEKETGVFIVSPSGVSAPNYPNLEVTKTYVDLYDLRNIAINTAATRTSTSLIDVKRIGKEWATNDIEPVIVTLPSASSSLVVVNHETTAERINDNKIRLYTSGFGKESTEAGGVCAQNVDFSNPLAVSYDGLHFWPYDIDREYPTRQTSGKAWNSNLTHTAVPITINSTKFVLTTQELASPFFDRGSGITPTLTISGGTYVGANWPILYDGTNENDKYLGNYLRVWETDTEDGFTILKGTGTYNGPLSSYDPVEQDPNSGSLYTSAALSNSAISIISSSAANSLSSSTAVGPNTIHRVRPVAGSTDVFISAYSQGIRVVDLKNLSISNPSVVEKAFFDYIPTLNYAKNSEYFYLNGNHDSDDPGDPSDSYSDFRNFFWPSLQSYFIGTFDVRADIERTGISGGLPSDEKFVYGMGLGEGYMSENSETLPRNWINNGGFMILRYFDDKIGGTISGYTGTSAWNNRSYRDVNLQGTFSVERNTTVASGATVNLLKNTNLNPKDGGGSEFIEIFGTVNVETLTEGGRGTIDVPIFVRDGGKLVVKEGAVVDFKKMVTVASGGELRIEADTKVVFGAPKNVCNGKLYILGTSPSHRAVIRATLNSGRTETVGNSSIIMRGQPEPPSITPDFNTNYLQIQYADVENVYIHSTDIKMHWPIAIYYSNFSGKDAPHNFLPLVSLWFRAPTTTTANRVQSKVHVMNCTFTDRAGKKADPGQYDINGLDISGYKIMSLRNSSFKFLKNAVYLDDCGSSLVLDNTIDGEFSGADIGVYSTSNVGVLSSLVVPRFCTNTLKDNYIGTQGFWNMTSRFYDNNYTRSYVGSGSISDDDIFYRSNTYDEYCLGIASIGVMMNHLRDFWWQGNIFSSEYGRNIFIIPSDRDDRWGCLPTDVLVNQKSDLEVHCGYNLFSVNSTLHIGADMSSIALHSAPNPALDISKNKWQKPGGHQVRSSIPFVGTPIDQAQTSSANCGDKSLISFCLPPVNPCLVTQLPLKDTMDMGEVINKYDSLWSNIADTTLSVFCRVSAAKHAFELSVVLDSVAIYDNNVSDFGTIANATSLPIDLRVTARALKGMSYERLGKRDSAILEYYQITQTSTALQADSLAAAWRMQYNYALANTANRDSAVRKYVDRVINDLHRIWDNSVAYKMASNSPLDEEESQANLVGISLEQNIPNPFEESTEISFTLPSEGIVQIAVIDILGNEVRTLINGEGKTGRNTISFKASDLPEGVYFYRLQFGNKVITKKMQKSR